MSVQTLVTSKSYYELLEVTKDSSDEDIKRAYRRLALKFHPDRRSSSERKLAEMRFRLINEAYAQIKTEARRNAYNRKLAGGNDNMQASNNFWSQVLDIFKSQRPQNQRTANK